MFVQQGLKMKLARQARVQHGIPAMRYRKSSAHAEHLQLCLIVSLLLWPGLGSYARRSRGEDAPRLHLQASQQQQPLILSMPR